MSLEIHTDIKPVRLWGIKYTPNRTAEEVERFLEVPYPVKPLRVELCGGRKEALIIASNLVVRRNIREALSLPNHLRKNFYLAPLHTFFVTGTTEYSYYIDRHENIHGWVSSVNSAFRNTKPNKEGSLLFCIDEGVAEWGAKEVVIRANIPGEKWDNPHSMLKPDEQRFHEFLIPQIRESIIILESTKLKRLNLTAQLKKAQEFVTAMTIIQAFSYEIGLFFVDNVIKYLEEHGNAKNEALVKIVKHPPLTIDGLANPLGFAEEMLSITV